MKTLKAPKTFMMWAVPYNAASLDKTLDVETAGACALFASPLLADEFVQKQTLCEMHAPD